mgnify:CR=1 FL=1
MEDPITIEKYLREPPESRSTCEVISKIMRWVHTKMKKKTLRANLYESADTVDKKISSSDKIAHRPELNEGAAKDED